MQLIPYQSDGRNAEFRSYQPDEGLTIEPQEDGLYVMAWSAHVAARKFLDTVATLVDDTAAVELKPSANGRPIIPLREAVDIVKARPDDFKFIAVDGPHESFGWEAVDPAAESRRYPADLGEVSIRFSSLKQGWLEQLLKATATPAVKRDIKGILESTRSLVGSTSPKAA